MNNHLMNNQERFVKWKCPECGNYHKWVWDIYDIFGGKIAMTCDNLECGRTSKMFMVVEKNGNATALVADNSQVEEKLRRATEKVMNSQTEIDISKVLIEGDTATIMGEKYKRVEEPKSPAEEAYKEVYGWYPPTTSSVSNYEDNRWSAFQNGYNASKVTEVEPSMTNCVLLGNPPDGYVTWNEWYNEMGSKGILHNLKISDISAKEYQQKSEKEQKWDVVRESVKWCKENPEKSVEDYLSAPYK